MYLRQVMGELNVLGGFLCQILLEMLYGNHHINLI